MPEDPALQEPERLLRALRKRVMRRPSRFHPFVDCLEGRMLLSSGGNQSVGSLIPTEVASTPALAVTTIAKPRSGEFVGVGPQSIKYPWLEVHEEIVETLSQSRPRTVFLGDSITARWNLTADKTWKSRFTRYRPGNAGISGDRIENLLWRIENGALSSQPRVAVVMIGINNVSQGETAEDTLAGIKSVLASIRRESPSTRILLLGLLPTREAWQTRMTSMVNIELAKCAKPGAVEFVDASRGFLDAQGRAKPSLFVDRVHLSKSGYRVLAGVISGALGRLSASVRAR